MPGTDGQVVFKQWSQGSGIDIIMGSAPSADAGIRILANDGKTVLAQINSIGNFVIKDLLLAVATKTANYVMAASDCVILADATAGNIAITLVPAATAGSGESRGVFIEKIDAGANTVTITAAGADKIEGAATKVLAAQFNAEHLFSDGIANWFLFKST